MGGVLLYHLVSKIVDCKRPEHRDAEYNFRSGRTILQPPICVERESKLFELLKNNVLRIKKLLKEESNACSSKSSMPTDRPESKEEASYVTCWHGTSVEEKKEKHHIISRSNAFVHRHRGKCRSPPIRYFSSNAKRRNSYPGS